MPSSSSTPGLSDGDATVGPTDAQTAAAGGLADNVLQRSVTTAVARNLATTTKTSPMMMSITP
ncbi:MAG: hypothetical protein ACKOK8_10655, partial [Planctomycetia bacterium]